MNEETEAAIVARFPSLFPEREKAPGGSPYSWFGFEIEDGWAPLIIELCERIQSAPVRFAQVKEKWGMLRVYVDPLDLESHEDLQWVYDAVSEVEGKSATICEVCGKPGKRRPGGWIKTECDEHWAEAQKRSLLRSPL